MTDIAALQVEIEHLCKRAAAAILANTGIFLALDAERLLMRRTVLDALELLELRLKADLGTPCFLEDLPALVEEARASVLILAHALHYQGGYDVENVRRVAQDALELLERRLVAACQVQSSAPALGVPA